MLFLLQFLLYSTTMNNVFTAVPFWEWKSIWKILTSNWVKKNFRRSGRGWGWETGDFQWILRFIFSKFLFFFNFLYNLGWKCFLFERLNILMCFSIRFIKTQYLFTTNNKFMYHHKIIRAGFLECFWHTVVYCNFANFPECIECQFFEILYTITLEV